MLPGSVLSPLRPGFDGQALESSEVLGVCRREHQAVHMGNRRDLPVDEWRWPTQRLKPRSLLAVPCRRGLVVRQERKRTVHDIAEILLQRRAPFSLWKPPTPVGQFVPDRRRDRALWTERVQTLENGGVRRLQHGRRDDARVEKIDELQTDTF